MTVENMPLYIKWTDKSINWGNKRIPMYSYDVDSKLQVELSRHYKEIMVWLYKFSCNTEYLSLWKITHPLRNNNSTQYPLW